MLRVVPTERPLCRRDRVQGVVLPNARCAAWFRAGVVRVGWRQLGTTGQPAEPIVAADRFAREIVAFWLFRTCREHHYI